MINYGLCYKWYFKILYYGFFNPFFFFFSHVINSWILFQEKTNNELYLFCDESNSLQTNFWSDSAHPWNGALAGMLVYFTVVEHVMSPRFCYWKSLNEFCISEAKAKTMPAGGG